MTRKEFDYETASKTVVAPRLSLLLGSIFDILQDIDKHEGLSQDDNLAIPLSSAPGIVERMRSLPTTLLAQASRVIHDAGHWAYSEESRKTVFGLSGAYWKFSNLADQILSQSVGLLPGARINPAFGIFVTIFEGCIRVRYSYPTLWLAADLDIFTRKNLERIQRAVSIFPKDSEDPQDAWETWVGIVKQDASEWWKSYQADTAKCYVPEGTIQDRQELRRAAQKIESLRATEKKDIQEIRTKTDGMVWLLEHGISTHNVIYYAHEPAFCFGWHQRISDTKKEEIRAKLKGFPFPWRFKRSTEQ